MADTDTPQSETLPLGLKPAVAPTAQPTRSTPASDPVEDWMTEFPTFTEPAAEAKTATETPVATTDAPTTAEPAATTATVTPPATADAKTETKTATEPTATTQTDPSATTSAPTAQPAKTLAADEEIELADGVKWTRSQIVNALQERTAKEPLAREAETFRTVFGMNAEQAQQAWGPILSRLQTEPNTVAFLDAYLSDPKKAEYLEKAAAHYDKNAPAVAAAPQGEVLPPAVAAQIKELHDWKTTQEQREAHDRIQREVNTATQKYPFLATEQNLMNDLILTAQALNARDSSKGLLDALELKKPMYDAILIARNAPTATTTTTTQPAATETPALLGSPGASPAGTRSAAPARPKSFSSLDDAVDDFMQNPPSEFK